MDARPAQPPSASPASVGRQPQSRETAGASPEGVSDHATRCDLCVAGPAIPVTFQHGVGLLFTRRVSTTAGTFCRDCGRALGRQATNRTLWTGWWGLNSFFANFAYVFGNARELLRLNRLSAPSSASTAPIPPGSSLFARSGVWFAVLLAIVGVGALSSSSDDSGYNDDSPPSYSDDDLSPADRGADLEWEVGACVRTGSSLVELVSCSTFYDGRIVKETSSSSQCPYSAESYVEDRFVVYCIDEE